MAFIALLAGALLLATATAVTPVSDSRMNDLLNQGGVGLAMGAAPMFFFGQAMSKPPCYPTFAVNNGQQAHKGKTCNWPNAGCDCRNPGVAIGNPGPSFPVYYTYGRCSGAEIRVAYNLFYEKDGFNPDGGNGHGL